MRACRISSLLRSHASMFSKRRPDNNFKPPIPLISAYAVHVFDCPDNLEALGDQCILSIFSKDVDYCLSPPSSCVGLHSCDTGGKLPYIFATGILLTTDQLSITILKHLHSTYLQKTQSLLTERKIGWRAAHNEGDSDFIFYSYCSSYRVKANSGNRTLWNYR